MRRRSRRRRRPSRFLETRPISWPSTTSGSSTTASARSIRSTAIRCASSCAERAEMTLVLALIAAYALGSIPAAYLAGQWKGIDLRKHGSGNLGATNVFRVLGPRIGSAVFAFDMLKGAVPVLYFARFVDPALVAP